jgi:hypothetical protein
MDSRSTTQDTGPSCPLAFYLIATFASGLVWLVVLLWHLSPR